MLVLLCNPWHTSHSDIHTILSGILAIDSEFPGSAEFCVAPEYCLGKRRGRRRGGVEEKEGGGKEEEEEIKGEEEEEGRD